MADPEQLMVIDIQFISLSVLKKWSLQVLNLLCDYSCIIHIKQKQ